MRNTHGAPGFSRNQMQLRRFRPDQFTREPRKLVLRLGARQLMAMPGMYDGTLPTSIFSAVHAAGAAPLVFRPPNPVDGVNYVNMDSVPLFADPISIQDTLQGETADCWELAVDGSIALDKPDLLRQLIIKEAENVYRVRFFRNGADNWVYVSADVPNNGVHVTRCLWPAIKEKACAFFRNGANTYASLDNGLNASAYNDEGFSTKQYAANAAGWAAAAVALAAGWPASVITVQLMPPGVALIGDHSHTVVAVDATNITFHNPWGFDGAGADSNPADGTVTIPVALASTGVAVICITTGFTPPLPFAPAATPVSTQESAVPPTITIVPSKLNPALKEVITIGWTTDAATVEVTDALFKMKQIYKPGDPFAFTVTAPDVYTFTPIAADGTRGVSATYPVLQAAPSPAGKVLQAVELVATPIYIGGVRGTPTTQTITA
jgi:hypothetical protein